MYFFFHCWGCIFAISYNQSLTNIPSFQRLRDGTVSDLQKFQRETEAALNQNLANLKKQIDDCAATKDRLARERQSAEECVMQLKGRVNALAGEVRVR